MLIQTYLTRTAEHKSTTPCQVHGKLDFVLQWQRVPNSNFSLDLFLTDVFKNHFLVQAKIVSPESLFSLGFPTKFVSSVLAPSDCISHWVQTLSAPMQLGL
jgi:hypothetical protein